MRTMQKRRHGPLKRQCIITHRFPRRRARPGQCFAPCPAGALVAALRVGVGRRTRHHALLRERARQVRTRREIHGAIPAGLSAAPVRKSKGPSSPYSAPSDDSCSSVTGVVICQSFTHRQGKGSRARGQLRLAGPSSSWAFFKLSLKKEVALSANCFGNRF